MRKKVKMLVLSYLVITVLLIGSCTSGSTKTTTSTTPPLSTATTTKSSATTTTTSTAATALTSTAATTTTAAGGNWWDSLGKPQYGGETTLRSAANITNFDPYNSEMFPALESAWMESLTAQDWALNPAVYPYTLGAFRSSDYVKGNLAQSWEITAPDTYVVVLRQGIHWQNIAPANGRELTSADVVSHYVRDFGLGVTKGAPYWAGSARWAPLMSVTATDKYTVVFKWKNPNPEQMTETLQGFGAQNFIENPDAVTLWGNLNDWHHAIGTGPFILQDFVDGSSMTLVKNSDYWAYDERYPNNKLPYVDGIKVLIIPDLSTAMAAMRTGKIDILDNLPLQQMTEIGKTNPAILQYSWPQGSTPTIDPRNDKTPFKDIRVREAMQMAVDLPTIASTYYGGTCEPWPSGAVSNYLTGWGFPYSQWPQSLKDQYVYDPTQAKQLLAAAGYQNGFNTDIVANTAGDLVLLQIVQSYFTAIGINMQIRPMDTTSWNNYVMVNMSHDALAFRSTGSGGSAGDPSTAMGRFLSNAQGSGALNYLAINDPVIDSYYAKSLVSTSIADMKNIVSQYSQYVAEQHLFISLVTPHVFALCQPWLKGYYGQYGSIPLPSATTPWLFFYQARFWIDQNLKHSG